jgi:hypothetical protein
MSIEMLTAVVPPPARPLEVEEAGRWALAQASLGVGLPQDYLDYALRYGSGSFGDPLWLEVWNPLGPRFLKRVNDVLRILTLGWTPLRGPLGLPLPLHPARPGVLPLASTLFGVTLCWYTLGEAGSWPLLLVSRGGAHVQPWLGPLTALLAQLHGEPLRTLMGPDRDPGDAGDPVEFRPRLLH